MSWAEIKKALNSRVGTKNFESLDKIIAKECYDAYYNMMAIKGNDESTLIVPYGQRIISPNEFAEQRYTQIVIPSTVIHIYDCAFERSSLKSIVIPDSVKIIDESAFSGTQLENVKLPKYLDMISDYLFASAFDLLYISLPCSVYQIGEGAFYGCEALREIFIPKSVKHIALDAFYGCERLQTVYYEGTRTEWETIDIASRNDALINATILYNVKE